MHKSLIIIVYTDFRSSFIMCIYYIYNTYSHRNISTCRSRAKEKNTVPLATGQIIVFLMDTTKPVNRFLARFDVSFSLLIVIHVAVQVSCFSKNLQCVRGEVSLVKKSVAIPERTLGRRHPTARWREKHVVLRDLVSEIGDTILGTPKSSLVNYDQWEHQWFGIAIWQCVKTLYPW